MSSWRRGYDIKPPQMEKTDLQHPINDPVYKDIDLSLLPSGESLKDTYNRVILFFQETIEPEIKRGKGLFFPAIIILCGQLLNI